MFDDKFTESKIFPTFHDRIKEGSRIGGSFKVFLLYR